MYNINITEDFKLKKIIIALLAFSTLGMVVYASSLGGSKADPILTETKLNSIISNNTSIYMNDAFKYYEESTIVSSLSRKNTYQAGFVLGDIITVQAGSKIILGYGDVTVAGSGKMIDSSDGREITNPYSLLSNRPYIVCENSNFVLTVTSTTANIVIVGEFSYYNPYETKYDNFAGALHSLNLFKGTDFGYELDRASMRIESIVMLVRLLGEEYLALNGEYPSSPFDDVPSWATPYVDFAYAKGYTKGVSDTAFGTYNTLSDLEYYTLVLRALGYEDDIDFTWNTSPDTAINIGLVAEHDDYFYRDFIAYVSFSALTQKMKGGEITLAQKLIENGIITQDGYDHAREIINRTY